MKLGAILTAMRDRAGMSQEELALKLNRSRSSVTKLENDKQTLNVPTLVQWAKATETQEVIVAFLCGMDGLSIMQDLFQNVLSVTNVAFASLLM